MFIRHDWVKHKENHEKIIQLIEDCIDRDFVKTDEPDNITLLIRELEKLDEPIVIQKIKENF